MQHGILWLALLICASIVVTEGVHSNDTWYTVDWYDNSVCEGIPTFSIAMRETFNEFDVNTTILNCTEIWDGFYITLSDSSDVPVRNESDWHAFYYDDNDNTTAVQHIWGMWGCSSVNPIFTITAHANATYATMCSSWYLNITTCDTDLEPEEISCVEIPVGEVPSVEGNIIVLVEDTYASTTAAAMSLDSGKALVVLALVLFASIVGL